MRDENEDLVFDTMISYKICPLNKHFMIGKIEFNTLNFNLKYNFFSEYSNNQN